MSLMPTESISEMKLQIAFLQAELEKTKLAMLKQEETLTSAIPVARNTFTHMLADLIKSILDGRESEAKVLFTRIGDYFRTSVEIDVAEAVAEAKLPSACSCCGKPCRHGVVTLGEFTHECQVCRETVRKAEREIATRAAAYAERVAKSIFDGSTTQFGETHSYFVGISVAKEIAEKLQNLVDRTS